MNVRLITQFFGTSTGKWVNGWRRWLVWGGYLCMAYGFLESMQSCQQSCLACTGVGADWARPFKDRSKLLIFSKFSVPKLSYTLLYSPCQVKRLWILSAFSCLSYVSHLCCSMIVFSYCRSWPQLLLTTNAIHEQLQNCDSLKAMPQYSVCM